MRERGKAYRTENKKMEEKYRYSACSCLYKIGIGTQERVSVVSVGVRKNEEGGTEIGRKLK